MGNQKSNNGATGGRSTPDSTAETTRRSFLKGSGTAASAGLLLQNPGVAAMGEKGRGDEEVPDEPKHGGKVRHFEVHAIEVDLVYNRYGLHQPNAAIYVLKEDLEEAREASGKIPCENNVVMEDSPFCDEVPDDKRADDVDTKVLQPLTLRANQGDIVEIEFHNHLDRTASMHQTSLPYDVKESDGMEVGFNPDTTVEPGESITYRWFADLFGTHFFLDGANQAYDSADEPPQVANLLSRGLFGGLNVLPQGSTWTDPYTGEERQGRVQADVHVPDDISEEAIEAGFVPGESFRQLLLYYHTPEGIQTADGGELTWPNSDEPQTTHAINYRADPTGNRIPALDADSPDIRELEESFYSSWLHGDPGGGDNAYPMYLGDPLKIGIVGASVEENHVHHLHGHRWKEVPPAEESDTIDSQTIGLGAVYEVPITTAFGVSDGAIEELDTVRPEMDYEDAFLVGAGGPHGSAGDYLFHCHLFPHYGEGMWGLLRVLDKEREGLKKLPNNDPPLDADSDIDGYPEFIPGEFGEAPPFPPYGAAGLDEFRDPTPEEEEALTRKGEILPGAPYTDPCNPDIEDFDGEDVEFEGEVRRYDIVALPANVVYNDAGDYNPEGKVFALEEDAEKIKNGEMNPEPLVIRANVGDCVEIRLRTETEGGKSNHIHFVSYDVLGSDSLANGFNYRQDTQPDQENYYRWFADEEGTIFFHDHITGVEDIQDGTFCAIVVEPKDSEWLDPYSGEPIRSGTQAIIKNPNGNDFREFCLAYHDFAPLLDGDTDLEEIPADPTDDAFVNPGVEHDVNAGVMAINYRNSPFYRRDKKDPAYVFSSYVHGDPPTPTLEAYENEPVRFRLWQGAYEEQHSFHVNGRHFEPEGLAPEETVSQIMGTSEAFSFDILPHEEGVTEQYESGDYDQPLQKNPSGLPVKDYLYGSTVIDDLWDGMWGIHRTFGAEVDHLEPLPDRGPPDGKISNEELKEMGHPAPFSDFDWADVGQEARLRYGEDDDRSFPPDKDERQNRSIDGNPPPLAPEPGDPCPPDAPVKKFDVSALQTTIQYNEYDDIDPFGTVFALDEYVEAIQDGDRNPVPLSLWVNEGDCIEVTLTNRIDPDEFEDHPHPQMRTRQGDEEWERSERVSLHSTHTEYNVLGSDGATVGFNWDQTIGPGESITYRWFVDQPTPGSILWDYADVRSTRHHGAYGQILAHEPGSRFVDSATGEPLPQGISTSSIIKRPDEHDLRAFAMAFADSQFIINEDDPDNCVVPPGPEEPDTDAPCNRIPDDPEDQGYMGINYRSEPFIRRLDQGADPPDVYDSDTFGDPSTPVFNAFLDDPVHFHVNKVADKARGISFHLSDHQWDRFRTVDEASDIGVDDRFTVAKSTQIVPKGDAGGLADSTGDFIYQEMKQRRRLESGSWGIFRVGDHPKDFKSPVQPLPDHAKGIPPKKRPGWRVACGCVKHHDHDDETDALLVGVPESDVAGVNAGAAYLFFDGEDRDVVDLLDADVQFLGNDDHDHAGMHVDVDDGKVIIEAGSFGRRVEKRYIFENPRSLNGTVKLWEADIIQEIDGGSK